MKAETITLAAKKANMKCLDSHCSMKHKFCSQDIWKGSLENFAVWLVFLYEQDKQVQASEKSD